MNHEHVATFLNSHQKIIVQSNVTSHNEKKK